MKLIHIELIPNIIHKIGIILHIVNHPYNFSIQNCPQISDRVQLRFQSPKQCIIKHFKAHKTVLY